jgi:uncharacterized protein
MFALAWAAAAVLSVASPSVTERPLPALSDARPALWVVNDHDTVIYLFGTFHALDGRSEWFNDEVQTAFAASGELVLETVVPQHLLAPRSRRAAGPPPASAEGLGPVAGTATFLSNSKVAMTAGRSRGLTIDKGADTILRSAAERQGKSVRGLESFDHQVGLFGRMRGAPVPNDPRAMEATQAALAALLAHLQAQWNRGNVEGFAPMLEQMRRSSPDTYKSLFADRNRRWAAWIADRLQTPGTVFVAVGAGHLAGRDSVQQRLAEAHIRSARIN